MKRFINCLDCGKRFDQTKVGVYGPELCAPCLEFAEWENSHVDNGHDEETPDIDCVVCMDEGFTPDTRKGRKTGHGKGGGAPTAPNESRTRNEILADLAKAGYTGPTSYVKRDLLAREAAFLATLENAQ